MSDENANKILTVQHYVDLIVEEMKQHVPQKDNDRAKLRAIKKIDPGFLKLPIIEATPQKIKEVIEPMLENLTRCDRIQIMAVIRRATNMAYNEHVIPYDYGKGVKIQDSPSQKQSISNAVYDKIQEGIFRIEGGKIFGLAAHLNAPMVSIISLKIEDCYENNNTISYIKNGFPKTVQLYDPDGVRIFQDSIREYKERMSDPAIAKANRAHFLFFTTWGSPYQEEHCNYILNALKDYSQCPDLNSRSLHHYIIKRSFHNMQNAIT